MGRICFFAGWPLVKQSDIRWKFTRQISGPSLFVFTWWCIPWFRRQMKTWWTSLWPKHISNNILDFLNSHSGIAVVFACIVLIRVARSIKQGSGNPSICGANLGLFGTTSLIPGNLWRQIGAIRQTRDYYYYWIISGANLPIQRSLIHRFCYLMRL